jgi:hypothetical protein
MRKAVIILSMFTLLGCGTQPQLTELINDMVVLTNFDETVNYNQYITYTMPMDTIGLVSNTSNDEYLANEYAKMITSTIKRNLDNTSHNQVAVNGDPDIGVNVVVVNDLSVTQSVNYYYPSYYGYTGYYGYGYGYGVPSYSYFNQAVLVIEFVDLKNTTSGVPKTIWVANIGDLVNSYDTSTKTKEAIDQAFAQSPFLNRE